MYYYITISNFSSIIVIINFIMEFYNISRC